ncbi:MAG: hypothetical protein JNM95_15065 [Chitinophagaceae bacterium]|nr:hypothetical protein [Chitinophagaceae bacterium]
MNLKVKKILRNILFLLAVPLIIGAFVFAQNASQVELYKGLHIQMQNPELSFVTQEDIQEAVENMGIIPDEITTKELDLKKVEDGLESNPWVEHSEIYLDAHQVMHVNIQQRNPVLRLQQNDSSGKACYLDQAANPFPLSEKFIVNVPVLTSPALLYSVEDLKLKTGLVHLAQLVRKDSFWNATITQIDVNDNREIKLIPVFNNQIILFGNTDLMEDKLNRLKAFYQNGLQTINWKLYDEIDARYTGEIVCRNSKGLILAEDPYESTADKLEKNRVRLSLEKEEQREAKAKADAEKQKQKEKELKAKQEAKEKELKAKQEAKEKLAKEKKEAKEKVIREMAEAKLKAQASAHEKNKETKNSNHKTQTNKHE